MGKCIVLKLSFIDLPLAFLLYVTFVLYSTFFQIGVCVLALVFTPPTPESLHDT